MYTQKWYYNQLTIISNKNGVMGVFKKKGGIFNVIKAFKDKFGISTGL